MNVKKSPDSVSRGVRVISSIKEAVNSIDDTDSSHCFRRAAYVDSVSLHGASNIEEYFNEVDEALSKRVHAVRIEVNRWYKSLGISLVSVRLIPQIDDTDVNPREIGEIKWPTLGLIPEIINHNAAYVGFSPDDGSNEVLKSLVYGFRAKIMPKSDTIATKANTGETLCGEYNPEDPPIIVSPGQMVVVHVPVFDIAKLSASGLPFAYAPAIRRQGDARLYIDQAYFCTYPQQAQ